VSFAADIRHWPTVEAFAAHLAAHDPASSAWVKGLTYHHTWKPTASAWRGRSSIDGLLRYYRDQVVWYDGAGRRRIGWSAGPHLFVGPDGIWQLTPLNVPGIHAVSFNRTHWGLEVVGNYDRVSWQEPIRSLALGAGAALLRWRGLPASAVNGHRDDPKTAKSCPGWAIDLDWVRAELQQRLSPPPAPPLHPPACGGNEGGVTPDSAILSEKRATAAQCIRYILSRPHGEYTDHDIANVIIPGYFSTCQAVGVDPLLAIAQMIHETGNLSSWWSERPRRNPAGIGVTGRSAATPPLSPPLAGGNGGVAGAWAWNGAMWIEGVSFASWGDDAIPAHVGRLLAYALRDDQASAAQRTLIAKALTYRPLPASYRGVAPTLRGLNGRWASPGTGYADAIARIANAIREIAA
jgi:hypothetical protein